MDVKDLKPHPENHRIYSAQDLSELENSLMSYGQLEPIVINKDKTIISGHRRFTAMSNLGWTDVDVRYIETENELIALIEHNRHRQKTASDILNESRILEEQLKGLVGRGRNATKKRGGKRTTAVQEVANKLGIGATSLKQLMSISNYDHDLVKKIDNKEISIGSAYQQVREKYIIPKANKSKKPIDVFVKSFKKLLTQEQPPIEKINEVLKSTYPYSLEMTGVSTDKRATLIEHLEERRGMNSRQYMLSQKQDELIHSGYSKTQLKRAKKYLPTFAELRTWQMKDVTSRVKKGSYHFLDDVRVIEVGTDDEFDNELWSMFRVHCSSFEFSEGPGRSMKGLIGFDNAKGFRLLGICSLHSDSHTLGVRDKHIGWTESQRANNREHLVNMNTCVPTQPFGFNRLGGKFMSLATTKLIPNWEKKYKTKVVGVMTTSLHGSTSQYSGMKRFYDSLGTTTGSMTIHPDRDTYSFWRQWYKTHYPNHFEEISHQTSPKQTMLNAIFRVLNIDRKQYEHGIKRGVYICPLYHNYKEFLCDEIKEKDLEEKVIDWTDWWSRRAGKRYENLSKENRLQKDQLWLDSINELDMENWLNSTGV